MATRVRFSRSTRKGTWKYAGQNVIVFCPGCGERNSIHVSEISMDSHVITYECGNEMCSHDGDIRLMEYGSN